MLLARVEAFDAKIPQDFTRRIAARRAHHTAAGMRRGAAHVHPGDRRTVLRVAGYRAVEDELVHREFALEDIALGQAGLVFDIPGAAGFHMADQVAEIRALFGDLRQNRFAELIPRRTVPASAI